MTGSSQIPPPQGLNFWSSFVERPHFNSGFPQSTMAWDRNAVSLSSSSSSSSFDPAPDYASFSTNFGRPGSSPSSTSSPATFFEGEVPQIFSKPEDVSSPVPTEPRPKKRRRSQPNEKAAAKSKAQLPLAESAGSTSTRAEKKRERNRIAATKCREKARAETSILAEREGQLSTQREELMKSIAMLKEEVYGLEQLCFSHVNCDCVNIRGYLLSKLNRTMHTSPINFVPERMPVERFPGVEENALFDCVQFS